MTRSYSKYDDVALIEGGYTVSKTIWQKCHENYYKTKMDYVSAAPIRTKIENAGAMLNETINTYPESAYGKVIEWTMLIVSPLLRELDSIEAKKAAYNADERRLDAEFRADIKFEFKTEDYPDESSIFSLARDEGHAYGYGEVLNHYSTIVEKFEPNIRRTKDLMTVAKAFLTDAAYVQSKSSSSSCTYCMALKGLGLHQPNCPVRLAEESIKPKT